MWWHKQLPWVVPIFNLYLLYLFICFRKANHHHWLIYWGGRFWLVPPLAWRHEDQRTKLLTLLSRCSSFKVAEIPFHISTAELCGNPALSQKRHKPLMQVTNCEKWDFQTSSAFFGLKAEAKWKEAHWHHSDRQHPVAHRTPCLSLESDTLRHWHGKNQVTVCCSS